MKFIVAATLGLSVLTYSSIAQQSLPPAEAGPSLAETMKFLQSELNEQKPVPYTQIISGYAVPFENPNSLGERNVVADPATCSINYQWWVIGAKVVVNTIHLANVRGMELRDGQTDEELMQQVAAESKSSFRFGPFFEIVIQSRGQVTNRLAFLNEDERSHVLRALDHAIKLCGGGYKPLF